MIYKVTKNRRNGKGRMCTDKFFKTKSKAQEYADATNMFYKGANARVIKVKK